MTSSFKNELATRLIANTAIGLPCHAVQMQEFGEGFIVIRSNNNQYEIYVDPDKWDFCHETPWKGIDCGCSPNTFRFTPNTDLRPKLVCFWDAWSFAKREFKPRGTNKWHETPGLMIALTEKALARLKAP